jgi:NAD(P)-dependent dehydrogenase (short-subunit alcohol dehydrogenase family)
LAADLTGKTVLVTGATRGIGLATAVGLARLGADLVLLGRSEDRLAAAADAVAAAGGGRRPATCLADYTRLSDVRAAAASFLEHRDRLDVLVNNAGLIHKRRELTADGNELTFQVDHLAAFLLTNLLVPALTASPAARVVTVASDAHYSARRLPFDDLTHERSYFAYGSYAEAKLANLLFAYELARRLEGTSVTSNAVHPGSVRTGFATTQGGRLWLWQIIRPFLRTPEQGAETLIHVASSPDVARVTGRYFADCREKRSSAASYDVEAARRLWALSEQLTGITAAWWAGAAVGSPE